MEIYANILNLSDEDKLILIQKLSFVSSIEEKHKETNKPVVKNTSTISSQKVIGRGK